MSATKNVITIFAILLLLFFRHIHFFFFQDKKNENLIEKEKKLCNDFFFSLNSPFFLFFFRHLQCSLIRPSIMHICICVWFCYGVNVDRKSECLIGKKVEVSLRLFDIFERNTVFIFLFES